MEYKIRLDYRFFNNNTAACFYQQRFNMVLSQGFRLVYADAWQVSAFYCPYCLILILGAYL